MRLLVCGLVHPEEVCFFPDDLDVTVLDAPCRLSAGPFREAVERVRPDAALFQFFGDAARKAREIGVKDLRCPKAAWFLDSHVAGCREQELEVAKLFDTVFLAHSRYLPFFRQHRDCQWMPACVFACQGQHARFAYPRLAEVPSPCQQPEWDVTFLFCDWGKVHPDYPSRAKVLETLTPHLDKAGIRHFFGEDQQTAFERMSASRVCLNLSTAGDFNIRNFEILALGRPLVTDRTTDHGNVPRISEFCHYYDPNRPDSLIELLQDMDRLNDADRIRRGFEFVRRGHTNLHRIMYMLEVVVGKQYRLKAAEQRKDIPQV
jgi:hypothetical protein